MSYPTLSDFQRSLPDHYRKWVRNGIVAAALGYCLAALISEGPIYKTKEIWVGLTCGGLLLAQNILPRAAGYAALSIIWLELTWSISSGHLGIRTSSVIALPLWTVAFALFFGKRAAWVATFATMAALPLAVYVIQPRINAGAVPEPSLHFLFVAEACVLAAAWLVTSFMDTLVEAVRRDRMNASRAAQLVENAPDAMVAVAEGIVVAFNGLAEEFFEIDRADIVGAPLTSLPSFPADLRNTSGTPQEVILGRRTLEMRRQHLEHEGEPPEQLLVFRDVTERAAAEKKSRDLQVQLEHAQRLEAIGQLAGGIAHDFNNLLTAFAGTAEILLESDDEQVRELAMGLEVASNRGAALTRQLLTFARREVVQPRVLDLSKVLEGSRTLLSHLLGERISLDFDLKDGCLIRADQGQIEQIILNLGANARDATEGAGTLSISTMTKDNRVLLVAQDVGCGMDEQTQKRIFEPFFTTKARDKGTGLGLSTVHGIVQHWEGTIDVESAPGQGTTFTISWPKSEADTSNLEPLSRAPHRTQLDGHLLLVEDNESALDITERLLRRSGFTVTTATSAEEALAMCRDGLHPDMLVSDVVMRGLTGVQLAERLREKRPDLPVLFISGYVDDVLRDWPFDTTQDLLLKPFAGEALLERIQSKLKMSTARIKTVV